MCILSYYFVIRCCIILIQGMLINTAAFFFIILWQWLQIEDTDDYFLQLKNVRHSKIQSQNRSKTLQDKIIYFHCCNVQSVLAVRYKEFENIKGIMRIRKSKKNRQHNGPKTKDMIYSTEYDIRSGVKGRNT